MGIGTFGSFTQARLAIYASHMGLSVTGNNIANINTTGYTRQKLDQESFRVGGADRYHSSFNIRVGNGVLTTGVSQLRDPYLDIRYRSEMSSVGAMDTKLGGLQDIQAILDEVGDGEDAFGVIEAQLSDLYDALQQLSDQTGHAEYDIQVRSSAESLTKQFNSYAAKLEEVYKNAENAFKQDITTVNGILNSIRDLNAAIRKNEIHGDKALEMKDERNMLIDQLSEYMKIDVTYGQEDIGAGQMVEKLIIKLANANPDENVTTDTSTLVDGIFATQLQVPESYPTLNPAYDKNYTPDPAHTPEELLKQYLYLKADGTGTNDAAEAAQEANDNLLITLAPLTNSKGAVMSMGYTLENNELSQTEYEALKNSGSTEVLADGTTITTSYYEKTTVKKGDPAKLIGDAAIAGLNLSDLRRSAIAKAAEAKGAGEGANISIDYDTTSQKFQLKAGDTVIGTSGQLPLPLGKSAKISFIDENGSALGAIRTTEKLDTFTLADTGLDLQAATQDVEETTYYESILTTTYSKPVKLDDNDLFGALQSERELLTEAGEFTSQATIDEVDENAATKRGIPYYQKALDLLANQIARAFNDANQSCVYNEKGEYITGTLNEDGSITNVAILPPIQYTVTTTNPDGSTTITNHEYTLKKGDTWDSLPKEVQNAMLGALNADELNQIDNKNANPIDVYVKHQGGILKGGPLFSNRGDLDDTTGITASNISISGTWSKGPQIVSSFELPTGLSHIPTTSASNIEHLVQLFTKKMDYSPNDVAGEAPDQTMFNGSFQEMWVNIGSVLGNDMKVTSTLLDTYYASSVNLDSSRMGQSGVDLNDEAMNLMQYSQSYNAACRLMTTLDSVLDKLINGTAI